MFQHTINFSLYFLLSLLTMGYTSGQGSLILDKVIVKVGNEYIMYSEVQELYAYARTQNPNYDESLQCAIIEQLMSKKLMLDQARLDSVEVSLVEIELELDKRMDYILRQMGGDEERFVSYYGKSIEEQKESMREPISDDMIQQRIQNSLFKDVAITPKEVVAFYKSIPEDSIPYLNAEVELGEINLKPIISKESKDAALEKIQTIKTRIVEGGEKFEELASIFSDDEGSARNGGELGWGKRGSYVPEFEAELYSLEPNEVSNIVETEFGYHLIQLLERRGNNVRARHILIKPEIKDSDIAKTKHLLDSIKMLIENDSISFEIAVRRYSNDKALSYNNGGRLTNPKTGDSFWETSELPYQIYFAIESLKEQELTEPLEFDNERGEKEYKIIRLLSKTRPHRASLETDFSRIKEFAKESKKNSHFNKWMDKKVASTFIEIIPQFSLCHNLDKYLVAKN